MVDLDEDATLTGNFESDYLAQCRRLDVKPMALRRFGFPLPPLPLPQTPAPERFVMSREADEGPSRTGEGGGAAGLDSDCGCDDAASRPSLSFYGSTDLLALDRQEDLHCAQRPYLSGYKYTPTINLQADESDDVYKVGVQGCRLAPGTIDIFTSCCSACVSISELSLCNCGLDEAQIAALCQLVAGSNVRSLCLDRNPLPQESDHIWAQLLAEDSLLKGLSLRGNRISDSGATHLGNALKTNKSLTMLNLWDNKFGRDGADGLAEIRA